MPKRHSCHGRKYYKRCRRCHCQLKPKHPPVPKFSLIPFQGSLGSGIGQIIGQFFEPGLFNFRDFRQARRILAIAWAGGGGGNSIRPGFNFVGGGSSGLVYVEFDITENIEGIAGRVVIGGGGGFIRFIPGTDDFNVTPGEDGKLSDISILYRPDGAPFRNVFGFTAFGGKSTGEGGSWLAQAIQGPQGINTPIPSIFQYGGENGNPNDNNNGGNAPSFGGYPGGKGGLGGEQFSKNGGAGQRPGGGGGGASVVNQNIHFGNGGPGGNALVLFIRLA